MGVELCYEADRRDQLITKGNNMKKISTQVRNEFDMCGLPDQLRAQNNVLDYASRNMSEAEYIEMYESGSKEYQSACDAFVSLIMMGRN